MIILACLTNAGRSGGFSATWTAPPPMIAPPQVQAQSLARAILTDMTAHLVSRFRCVAEGPVGSSASASSYTHRCKGKL